MSPHAGGSTTVTVCPSIRSIPIRSTSVPAQPDTLQPPPKTRQPLFTGLNHVSRECRDPEKMADFYTSLLGFSRVPAPKFEVRVYWD